jgi:hypothetical protein
MMPEVSGLQCFSVGLPYHAAGKYLLVPWEQVLARCVLLFWAMIHHFYKPL